MTIEEIVAEAYGKGITRPAAIRQFALEVHSKKMGAKSLHSIMWQMRKEGRLPKRKLKEKIVVKESLESQLQDFRDKFGFADMSKEEEEDFLTDGGKVKEVVGEVTITFRLVTDLDSKLHGKDLRKAFIDTAIDLINDGESLPIIKTSCDILMGVLEDD